MTGELIIHACPVSSETGPYAWRLVDEAQHWVDGITVRARRWPDRNLAPTSQPRRRRQPTSIRVARAFMEAHFKMVTKQFVIKGYV